MNNYKKLLILLLILLGVAGIFVYLDRRQKINFPRQGVTQELKASLSINEKSKTESFDITQYIDKSTLEATKNFAKIEETGTGQNAFITSINGIVADQKKHEFWELLINSKSSSVGAGSYKIQNGDSILWHINTY